MNRTKPELRSCEVYFHIGGWHIPFAELSLGLPEFQRQRGVQAPDNPLESPRKYERELHDGVSVAKSARREISIHSSSPNTLQTSPRHINTNDLSTSPGKTQ